MTEKINANTVVKIAKGVAITTQPDKKVLDILYAFDEGKIPSAADINVLTGFIHEKQNSWLKPKNANDMINDIMMKISGKPRGADTKYRHYGNKPMTKDELVAIHTWVMSQK